MRMIALAMLAALVGTLCCLGLLSLAHSFISKSRGQARGTIVSAVVIGLLASSINPALAVSEETTETTYTSFNICATGHVYIDDTGGRPHMNSWTLAATTGPLGYSCSGSLDGYLPAGYAAVKQELWIWDWDANTWALCPTNPPWIYNRDKEDMASTGFSWGAPPCGANYYLGQSAAYVYDTSLDPDQWRGGWLNTNSIWVQ